MTFRRGELRSVVQQIPEYLSQASGIGEDDHRVFVVLDPDVKNLSGVATSPGARVTLIGLVRAAPAENEAIAQWGLDPATAKAVRDRGTYLHVTEIKPAV